MDPITQLTGLLGGLTGLATVFGQIVTAFFGFAGVFVTTVFPTLATIWFSTLGPFAGT